ncbi:MAG: transcription antitermination factor NusB [Pseudomonadota bacterium]
MTTNAPDARGRSARRLSRLISVQGLYQWLIAKEEPGAIEAFARESDDFADADEEYFKDCFYGALRQVDALREDMLPSLDRPLAQVSPVEQAILLLGAYELKAHPEVPFRVVINEGVELAKSLGGNEGHRYINGVLDRLASQLRPHEVSRR